MIFNDTPALLGFVIALYGVVKSQRTRLQIPQIVFFVLVPIALGWQPYAVFVTWFLVDLIIFVAINKVSSIKGIITNVIRFPSFVITLGAIAWGSGILGFQLLNEWRVVGGPFTALSTWGSMLVRLGVGYPGFYIEHQAVLKWDYFLYEQARRILLTLIPFGSILNPSAALSPVSSKWLTASFSLIIGMIFVYSFKYFRDKDIDRKILIILPLSGLLWAIPMKNFVIFHDFQSIYYIGFPIALYIFLGAWLNPRIFRIFAIPFFFIFVMSVYQINGEKEKTSHTVNEVTAEFQTMYTLLPKDSKVYIDGDRHQLGIGYYAVDFYLINFYSTSQQEAEYVITENPHFNGTKLTSNARLNLYHVVRSR